MTDITKLAQREKFEAWWESEYKHLESSKYTDAVPHIKYGFWMAYQAGGAELVEAVEKAQGMETYWKTQCRGITDHCEELQARIAELESNTVKPPVHPTVASEKLDDETLQELIEFRRTTFEYHSKEGNKVQTIIHGVTLAALRELQERRKADSEPVATLDVQSRRPDGNKFALVFSSAAHKLPDDVYFLYRHAQPAPKTEPEPIAWLNDAYLARGVVDGEAGSEDAGPGYIPVYREAGPHQAPVVSFYRDGIEASAKWIDQQREAYDSEHGWSDPDTGTFEFGNDVQREYSSTLEELAEGIRALHPNAGNSPVILDAWIPVSEQMPGSQEWVIVFAKWANQQVLCWDDVQNRWTDFEDQSYYADMFSHWMPLPAAPQEVKGE